MNLKSTVLGLVMIGVGALSAGAHDREHGIEVTDVYAFAANPAARSGAIFMRIDNKTDEDVKLIGALSDVAKRTEIHQSIMDGEVMRMEPIEGLEIPAGGCAIFARGGYHVMFMGLEEPFADGEEVALQLQFEDAAPMIVIAPVDLERDEMGGSHDKECVQAMGEME